MNSESGLVELRVNITDECVRSLVLCGFETGTTRTVVKDALATEPYRAGNGTGTVCHAARDKR